jgi:energy-coupling factor transporter ATP-binding protein EcfA2
MIHEIDVANYQSLGRLQLKLGRFTVITGRTGAGKSALIRAIRALAFNVRGTGDVMRGEPAFTVSMTGGEPHIHSDEGTVEGCPGCFAELWDATIRRGSKDHYQLAVGISQKTYTKLQGKVPEAVSDTLRLSDINFATQFDRPYLLDATGGEVARVLGRLTNVTVLFRAAQEANRRRLGVSGELRTRQNDLLALQEQIAQYATLGDEHRAVESAEASLAALAELGQKRARLGQLVVDHELAWRRLHSLQTPPEPPSLETLEELVAQQARLAQAMMALRQREAGLASARWREDGCTQEVSKTEGMLAEYVNQWGVCPACGQPVQKSHVH